MKYSLFTFFLLFTLSTSDDFGIEIKSGVFVWQVPEKWGRDREHLSFKLPNAKNVGIPKSDKTELDTVTSEMEFAEHNIPKLHTDNAYIILVIDINHRISCYYWIGANSSKKKKINTANTVGFMMMDELPRKICKVVIQFLFRETEGNESKHFRKLFGMKDYDKEFMKLFRVAGSEGQFIMQIPLEYSKMNGSDSFVLSQRKIRIWNSRGANKRKEERAKALGKYIIEKYTSQKVNNRNLLISLERVASANGPKYYLFRRRFFKHINGVPPSGLFPEELACYTDEELLNERKENLKLIEYSQSSKGVIGTEITNRPLTLDQLKTENAYILADFLCGNTFAYLGLGANTKQVQKSLSVAERISLIMNVKNAWQQVKVMREGYQLVINFLVNFSDVPF